jgi:hypothetical protein
VPTLELVVAGVVKVAAPVVAEVSDSVPTKPVTEPVRGGLLDPCGREVGFAV